MRRRLHRQGPLWGGQAAGPSPVDRGRQGTKRSVMVEGHGIPVGVQVAPANRHDSPLLAPTLECLGRFGFDLPEHITVHLDAGHDSRRTRELLEVLGCDARISPRGTPLQAGRRWVIEAFIALANTIITIRNLIHHAWTTHRWDQQPTRKP